MHNAEKYFGWTTASDRGIELLLNVLPLTIPEGSDWLTEQICENAQARIEKRMDTHGWSQVDSLTRKAIFTLREERLK